MCIFKQVNTANVYMLECKITNLYFKHLNSKNKECLHAE